MRSCRFILRTVLVAALTYVLVACSSTQELATATLAPANAFTEQYLMLSPDSITTLMEVAELRPSAPRAAGVSAVAYSLSGNVVLAAYAGQGYIVGWDLSSGQIVGEHDVDFVTPRGFSFDIHGQVLMGAAALEANATEHMNGLGLWDARTGHLIKCLTYPCTGNVTATNGYIGAAMDVTGNWVLIYSESVISVLDLSGATPGRISQINDMDSDYLWQISTIAIDSVHRRFAVVLQEGGIWQDDLDSSAHGYQTILEGIKQARHVVQDAKYDPTGSWLGVLQDNQLSVWELEPGRESQVLNALVSDGFALRFDQAGHLLFVAADNKIVVWDLLDKAITAEYETPSITALEVSQDNRMVLWGDALGVVHVWGAPKP